MFFLVSKVVWIAVQPVSLTFLLVLAGAIMGAFGRRRLALVATGLGLTVLGASAFTTLGTALITPLEERFARPREMPAEVSTIIMLGGASYSRISTARQISELNEAGDRLTETLRLAQIYPEARIVLSGGSGMLMPEGETEAETGRRFFTELGIDPTRLVTEGSSRNTGENVANSVDLLSDVPGHVLLVTSAFHMPRSVGAFRQAGLEVIPWPVDYRSAGTEGFGVDLGDPAINVLTTTLALREWIGLAAYAIMGRTDGLLPAQVSN